MKQQLKLPRKFKDMDTKSTKVGNSPVWKLTIEQSSLHVSFQVLFSFDLRHLETRLSALIFVRKLPI